MGDASEDILATFGLSADDKKKIKAVTDKFEAYFIKRKNYVYERAKFNRRMQQEGEPVDSFITALYSLAENCNYGALREELIRDRIVIGIKDLTLSERLQCMEDLTLQKAITACRQQEAVKKQQATLRNSSVTPSPAQADAVKSKFHRNKFQDKKKVAGVKPKTPPGRAKQQPQSQDECHRCGIRPTHPRDMCPARNAECGQCGETGHYQKKCWNKPRKNFRSSKNVKSLDADPVTYAFLGSVDSSSEDKDFHSTLLVNGVEIEFKVDTGADVTVMSESHYRLVSKVPLQRPDVQLKAANKLPFKVLGMVDCDICFREQTSHQRVYVVDSLVCPLLGKPAIKALKVVTVCNVDSESFRERIMKQFPKLFSGLGELEGEYNIQLKEDAQPKAISSPRRIAHPLMPKVEEALEQMVKEGVIRKLGPDEASAWCSGMVVVPKANGSLRICVDLSELNKAVIRPRYMLPTVDYTLAQLHGSKVFTKLDANAGFHQVKLSQQSQLLTTFLSPFGRFCFLRMPFGISSGPEYFTARMTQILRQTQAHCQMDDVIVGTPAVDGHEETLIPVLQKLEKAGVTLNPSKCEFLKPKVDFVGHTVTEDGIQAEQEKVKAIVEMEAPTNIHELRRFLGMVNQMSKFSSHLTEVTQPIRELLSKKNAWHWGPAQETAFRHVKVELSSPTVLAMYDPQLETKVSADASSYGVGAVLLQKHGDRWRPVYYASRSMTPTEKRYAQVEREAPAVTGLRQICRLPYFSAYSSHRIIGRTPLFGSFFKKNQYIGRIGL